MHNIKGYNGSNAARYHAVHVVALAEAVTLVNQAIASL